ncbi:MAG: hypothetical protein LAT75_01725 [Candidatus Cyclonatronum sp.]|uniref:hypothetical protein n=1 Tax=Cyclonatronum sp. TaxID=3024185 RepID=UPI0025C27958|nr:hypothetical protein [Cyclonatronum sp.]MCC5933163.1 hypothetical protein [Balneolales bacterium]MCH8485551.1 hypothetical protein [Cyclonatronum sp.]
MKKIIYSTLTAFFLLLSVNEVNAQSFGAKLNFGTQGIGFEGIMRVYEPLNVRVGGNFLNASYLYETSASDDYDVDASLSLSTFSALLDWHPYKTSLRLSAGLVYNANAVNTSLLPKKSYTIGGDVYSPDELGNLDAEVTFSPVSPYLGIGFGNVFSGSRFGFNTDFGVLLHGKPAVSLTADGLLSPSASQAPQLEENLSWATLYPVITFSFTYRIN